MNNYLIIILAFILIGALEFILGIPFLLGDVKPNWIYGFIFLKILSSDEIWYK